MICPAERKATPILVGAAFSVYSEGERDEYEMYVLAGEFIAILLVEARLLLAGRGKVK
jgi:hypothetical protein